MLSRRTILGLILGLTLSCHFTPSALVSSAPTMQSNPSPPNDTSILAYGSSESRFFILSGTSSRIEFNALDLTQQWNKDNPQWVNLGQPNFSPSDFQAGTYDILSKGFIVLSTNSTGSKINEFKDVNWVTDTNITMTTDTNIDIVRTTPQPFITGSNDGNTSYIVGSYLFSWDVALGGNTAGGTLISGTEQVDQYATLGQINNVYRPIRTYVNTTSNQLELQFFDHMERSWSFISTTGEAPSGRVNHCFISSIDAKTLYLFGGTSSVGSPSPLGDLYSIELTPGSMTWKLHTNNTTSSTTRSKMACGISGNNTFVVWGGVGDNSVQSALVQPEIFSLSTGTWVGSFSPAVNPDANLNPTNPGNQTPSTDKKSGTNVGVIVGGVVGGVVVVVALAAFLIMRKRRSRESINTRSMAVSKLEDAQGMAGSTAYSSIPPKMAEDYSQGSPYPAQSYIPNAPIPPLEKVAQPHLQSGQYSPLTSQPVRIQSPFEAEPDSTHQHPLLHSNPLAYQQLQSTPQTFAQEYYHDRNIDNVQTHLAPRSIEPATVDLIPITASEAGEDSDISRSNSLVSGKDGASKGGSLTHTKSRGSEDKRELYEQEESRRDSSESLDYLDIS